MALITLIKVQGIAYTVAAGRLELSVSSVLINGKVFCVINGLHAIIYAKDADKVRAFLRDTLGFKSVDAGHGWLIFALPPAELACHPASQGARTSST